MSDPKETSVLELLVTSSKQLSSQTDLEKLVQTITDVGTQLTHAQFGAFFYNVINKSGEKYVLYTISGVPREMFSKFPMPRNTKIFNPTFQGEGIIRYDDVTKQPHFGQNPPYHGHPKGHLPVRSYLAAPVISSIDGEVIGGLFFGHPDAGVFTEDTEKLIAGIAAQAAISMTVARFTSDLERKVKERTAELEKINYELLQFTSVASHDLKEPLRKISVFSKLLREKGEGVLDESLTKYTDNIIQSSERMTNLIDDLLAFSRLSQSEISFEDVDLNLLLAQIVSDLEITINEKKATIKFEDLPVVKGITLQLGQVFQNLISNSLKFSHPGRHPEITITASTIEKDGRTLNRISFFDNGIGFDNAHSEKIFEIFQRLHSKDQFEGTGVGLSIVKKIITMHGGEIRAFSDGHGKGSTFEILM
jgi:signal transduction histidine kinase